MAETVTYVNRGNLATFLECLKQWVGDQLANFDLSKYETVEDANKAHEDLEALLTALESSKQDKLTAGTGMEITDANVINCILDTTVFIPVDTLPDPSQMRTDKIYCVPNPESTEEDNVWDEYYLNPSTGKVEKVGSFKADVDLSDYYTKEETDKQIADATADMLTKTEAASTYAPQSDTYTKEQVDDAIANVKVDLSDYYTKEETDDTFQVKGDYATNDEVTSLAETIQTLTEELQALTGDTVTWQSNDEYLLAAVDSEDSLLLGITKDAKLYIPVGLPDGIVGLADLLKEYAVASDYYTKEEIDQIVAEIAGGGVIDLTSYLTKKEAEETYQPIGDYAAKSDIPTKVSQLEDADEYLTKTVADETYATADAIPTFEVYSEEDITSLFD